MEIRMPKGADYIIRKLNSKGYQAYFVGGCVRDCLLGKSPQDWDIATSALPEQVMKVMAGNRIIPTGLKHGTVTVGAGDGYYEVTTYRIDGDYSDGRHPQTVTFTGELREDLRRRDFTINAMAYSPAQGLADFFGGLKDLQNKVLRCVGNPQERFTEDYLRMLRAYRIAAFLDFEMEEQTREWARMLCGNIQGISAERIQSEFSRLIMSGNMRYIRIFLDDYAAVLFPEIEAIKGYDQNTPYHDDDVYNHTLRVFAAAENSLSMKLAALLHDTGKPLCKSVGSDGVFHFYGHAEVSAEIATKRLKALKYDNATLKRTVDIIRHHDDDLEPNRVDVKHFMNRLGAELGREVIVFQLADTAGKSQYAIKLNKQRLEDCLSIIDEIVKDGEPFEVGHLAVNGKDVMQELEIKPGARVREVLEDLVEVVIREPQQNSRQLLIDRIKKLYA